MASNATEWEIATLGELGQFRNGVNFSQDDYGTGFPIINVKQLYGGRFAETRGLLELRRSSVRNAETVQVKPGDILFARSSLKASGAGQVAMVGPCPPNTVFSGFIIRLRVEELERADPSFLAYVLRSPVYRELLTRIGSGTTITNLSQDTLAGIEVDLPPLPEQHAIAHILGTLDDKIELNRRMNETLESIARALFKSWFVDFLPVRAKMAARTQAGDPGLPKLLADLFPARLVDSQLGEIPEGWGVGAFGDVAEHPRRGAQPDQIEPGTPYIALAHMPKRCIALSDWGTAEGLESGKFEFKAGEILFGKLRPYFHKVGVAPVDGVCSTDIVVVVPRTKAWFGFVLCHVSSDALVEYTNAGSTGTKMPRTSWGDIARYAIAVPPEPVAAAFTNQVRPAVDRIISGIHESCTLAALRDTLLPGLMSGGLRIAQPEETA